MSCAICFIASPKAVLGYSAPFSGWYFDGSADFIILIASNASFAVRLRTESAAAAYSDSKDACTMSVACPARMPNWPIWLIASAGSTPWSVRGRLGASATARNGVALACSRACR